MSTLRDLYDATVANDFSAPFKQSVAAWMLEATNRIDGVTATPPPPPPPPFTVSQSIANGQVLSGLLTWSATASVAVNKVEFYIDGVLKWTEGVTPYEYNGDGNKLDPSTLTPGSHEFKVVVTAASGVVTSVVNATVQAAAPPPPPPPPSGLTKTLFAPMAESALDPVMNTTSASDKQYVNDHYYRIIKLWGSKWATFYKNGHAYVDMAAIYTGSPEAAAHPDWALKDSSGHVVYIPWGNKNPDGSYAQIAADQSNAGFRQWILDRCKAMLALGYVGIHFDDANLPYSTDRTPYRNGVALSDSQQKEDIVAAIEWYRAQLGPTVEISANTRWFDDGPNHDATGPYTQRILKAVDWVCKEGGILDGGLTTGTAEWSVDRLFKYCDNVHAAGKSVVWMSYADSVADTTKNLACYLLCRENRDMVSSHLGAYPATPFAPYNLDPGKALGVRTKPRADFWQREFEHATVTYDHTTKVGTVTAK